MVVLIWFYWIAVDCDQLITAAFFLRIYTSSPLRTQFKLAVDPLSPLLASKDSFSIYESLANDRVTAVALELPEWGILSIRGEDRLKVRLCSSEESLLPFTISLIFLWHQYLLVPRTSFEFQFLHGLSTNLFTASEDGTDKVAIGDTLYTAFANAQVSCCRASRITLDIAACISL